MPLLGCERLQREQARVAHYAKVTGGCDSETSSLAADHDVGTHALHCGDEGFT